MPVAGRYFILKFLLLCLLLCQIRVAVSQHAWYEPGTFQEMLLLTGDIGDYNGERYFVRSLPMSAHMVRPGSSWMDHDPSGQSRGSQAGTLYKKKAGYAFSNLQYLIMDNPETGYPAAEGKEDSTNTRWLWKHPAMFFLWTDRQKTNRSTVCINPVLNLAAGPSSQFGSLAQQNGRGIELRASLAGKLGIYTRVVENQTYFPDYINRYRDSFGVVPGLGWWKKYGSRGTDYLQAIGYFTYAVIRRPEDPVHVNMSMGHGSFQVGNGYRSLILGNDVQPYLFLKFNTRIGPFYYQNIFGQMNGFSPLLGNTLLPKKYMAMHRAAVMIGKHQSLELALNEMTIHSRSNGGFDPEYLNPVIFYRAIEANQGSADNSLMAIDGCFRWKGFRFYGQFMLDEFKLSNMQKGEWWGNKNGLQLGFTKVMTNGPLNILFQAEYNKVRPYTYSHMDPANSYTHYNQPLAHPQGANFSEGFFRLYVQPKKWQRLHALCMFNHARQGQDSWLGGRNFGSNPRRDNDFRTSDFGVKMYQGANTRIQSFRVQMTYMLRHNVNLDLTLWGRNQTGNQPLKGTYLTAGFRWNFEPVVRIF
ncbi:MAG: hypothetical protein JNL57_08630 [Bacteroidetes bacterium]|nr:hypothetical protein [Bacteroidota bacterium]